MQNCSYEVVSVPRDALDFPLVLPLPSGFKPAERSTWPDLPGRLEYVRRRLLFMPPCGDDQQSVAVSVAGILDEWATHHPEFFPGSNEAGMVLNGEVRGADGAVWRRADLPSRTTGGFHRVAPLLAIEIAGQDESESKLKAKARWYFKNGVQQVWLVLPDRREVIVMNATGKKRRFKRGDRLPASAELPGLVPDVTRFFRHLR